MNVFYLGAVISGRTFNLLCLLLLSHILSMGDFGLYALAATNAQVLYLLFGAWIPNFAWRKMSTCKDDERAKTLSEITYFIKIVFVTGVMAGIFTSVFMPGEIGRMATVAIFWAIVILIFDTTLVILNSAHRSGAYARLSFLRGVLFVLLSTGLAAGGLGVWGAVAGSVVATALATLAHPGILTVWRRFNVKAPVLAELIEALRFGLAGVLVLNIYIAVNAVVRNFVGLVLGPEEAGYASLAADLFYAPIALFVMAVSLSKIPHLYREAEGGGGSQSGHHRELLLATLATSLPYMAAGAIVASPLAELLLDVDTVRGVAPMGALAAIQGGCFALIATQTTIGLTLGYIRYAVVVSLATLAAVALALVLASNSSVLMHYMLATTLALMGIAALTLVTSKACLSNEIPVFETGKIVFATVMMVTVMALVKGDGSSFRVLLSIAVGGAVYIAIGLAISSQGIRQILRLFR